LFEPFYLDKASFKDFDTSADGGSNLTDAALGTILTTVEELRARSLASRQTFLINDLCDTARGLGITTAMQGPRTIDVIKNSNSFRVFATVGVPDAVLVQETERELSGLDPKNSRFLYDPRSITPAWIEHLEWLDKHVPLKALKLNRISAWLGAL
jgi:hypothetical protein